MKLKINLQGKAQEYQVEQPCTCEEQEGGGYRVYAYPCPMDAASTSQPVGSRVLIGKFGQREVAEGMVEHINGALKAGNPEFGISESGFRFKWLLAVLKKSPRLEALLGTLLTRLMRTK